jgi:biotin carboxyl carrier protein
MSLEERSIAERVRELAAFLTSSDAVCVRVEGPNDAIEIARYHTGAAAAPLAESSVDGALVHETAVRVDSIKADLVGIFRFGRPVPFEGEELHEDRELAYIEALGMRNPVRSLGTGRIVSIAVADGAPVEYGQSLFLLDRG